MVFNGCCFFLAFILFEWFILKIRVVFGLNCNCWVIGVVLLLWVIWFFCVLVRAIIWWFFMMMGVILVIVVDLKSWWLKGLIIRLNLFFIKFFFMMVGWYGWSWKLCCNFVFFIFVSLGLFVCWMAGKLLCCCGKIVVGWIVRLCFLMMKAKFGFVFVFCLIVLMVIGIRLYIFLMGGCWFFFVIWY